MCKKTLTSILLFIPILMSAGCGPSQDQVDKSLEKYMKKKEEEKQRVFGYIDEYIRSHGGQALGGALPAPSGADSAAAPNSLEARFKNPIKVDIGDSPVRGRKSARVTIITFSDFQCPFCSRVLPALESVMKKYDGKVRLVFKNQPLTQHNNAKLAALAGVAAQKQGKFWEMHDKMFAQQDKLDRESLITAAKELGLDPKRFEKDLDDPKTLKRVNDEIAVANQNGLTGTPSFLINGVSVIGAVPESEFSSVIDKALELSK